MDDGDCSGSVLGMRQRNFDSKSAGLSRQACRQPMEHDRRSTIDIPCNLDLSPADATSAWKGLKRLINRLLGGDPGAGMTGRVRSSAEVIPLRIGKEPRQRLVALGDEQT